MASFKLSLIIILTIIDIIITSIGEIFILPISFVIFSSLVSMGTCDGELSTQPSEVNHGT